MEIELKQLQRMLQSSTHQLWPENQSFLWFQSLQILLERFHLERFLQATYHYLRSVTMSHSIWKFRLLPYVSVAKAPPYNSSLPIESIKYKQSSTTINFKFNPTSASR